MNTVFATDVRVGVRDVGNQVIDWLSRALVDDDEISALERDPAGWPSLLRDVIEREAGSAVEPLIRVWGEEWNAPIDGVRLMTYPAPHLHLEMMVSTMTAMHLCAGHPDHPLPPLLIPTDDAVPKIWHGHEALAEWLCKHHGRNGVIHRAYLIAMQPIWHLRRQCMVTIKAARAGHLDSIRGSDPLPIYRIEAAKTLDQIRPTGLAEAKVLGVELLERWAAASILALRGAVTPCYGQLLAPEAGEAAVHLEVARLRRVVAVAETAQAVYAAIGGASA